MHLMAAARELLTQRRSENSAATDGRIAGDPDIQGARHKGQRSVLRITDC